MFLYSYFDYCYSMLLMLFFGNFIFMLYFLYLFTTIKIFVFLYLSQPNKNRYSNRIFSKWVFLFITFSWTKGTIWYNFRLFRDIFSFFIFLIQCFRTRFKMYDRPLLIFPVIIHHFSSSVKRDKPPSLPRKIHVLLSDSNRSEQGITRQSSANRARRVRRKERRRFRFRFVLCNIRGLGSGIGNRTPSSLSRLVGHMISYRVRVAGVVESLHKDDEEVDVGEFFRWVGRPRGSRGGGIGFIFRRGLSPDIVRFDDLTNLEVLGLHVILQGCSFLYILVYLPGTIDSEVDDFSDFLRSILNSIMRDGGMCFMCVGCIF